jgi:hypothetical protein
MIATRSYSFTPAFGSSKRLSGNICPFFYFSGTLFIDEFYKKDFLFRQQLTGMPENPFIYLSKKPETFCYSCSGQLWQTILLFF